MRELTDRFDRDSQRIGEIGDVRFQHSTPICIEVLGAELDAFFCQRGCEAGPRWAFEAYATGEYSVAQLRDALSDQGFTTRATAKWKSGQVSLNQLSLILRDPYYLGMVTYKGEVFDGRHEALISAETFERVQEIYAERSRPVTRDRVHRHFLRGLMCCDRCHQSGRHHRMIYIEAKNRADQVYGYYICRGRQDGACDLQHLSVRSIEHAVAATVKVLTLEPGFISEMRRHVHEAVELEQRAERASRGRMTSQLQKLETHEANLIDVAADGALATAAVKDRLREIAVQRRNLLDKPSRSEEQARRQADTVLAYLDLLARRYSFYVTATDQIQRKVLEAFFSNIWIEDDGHEIVARTEFHEPIVLIQAAEAEWQIANAKSVGDDSDALDRTPSNLYLKVLCSACCRMWWARRGSNPRPAD
ncbi:recombinase family protein [Salinibacterium sp. ZJ70]|uniref:recombinase family protein n=1 Tax=Salinibacterium sp. ZJ70 TaxID=2708084 RepID=UPI001CD6CD4D